ncbi:MAG: iron-containing redox enzyme family protein [Planctomycetota bacterium]|nr:iron-containing redox enzyme family protein [Planctomycetota bacterium]
MTRADGQTDYISEDAVGAIKKIGECRELPAGEQFIEMGEFDESIYFVESGKLEVFQTDEVIGSIEAGDVVGEMAFIDRRPRTASVRTATDSVLFQVERADLLKELSGDAVVLMDFVRSIEARREAHLASESETEVDEFLTKVAEEATAHRAVNHPYLEALREKSLPDMKWALADFARQYHGYSAHFPRYLTTVIGRLELPEHRAALMENLTEEAGIYESEELDELAEIGVEKGWVDGVPHPILFRRFCEAAGIEDSAADHDSVEVICWREMFLAVLSGGSTAEALGALGLGTENVVSTMYQHFLPALEVLDVPASETVFFPLHAAVDDHHQETLMDISRHYAGTETGRLDLLKGMRKALALRAGFWDWLHMRALTKGACDQKTTVVFGQ